MDRSEPALVVLGGFTGATFCYAVSVVILDAGDTPVVNVLGSSILGTSITSVSFHRAQLLFRTGLLSSFMTHSAFAIQIASLSSVGGVLNVSTSYILSFAATAPGLTFGGWR